jgi:prepilin-type N-terminal cleavage/methylation domain-containing protein
MDNNRPRRGGYSLIELLMVIAVMAVVAAALIPSASNSISEQLEAAARVLAADLDYARTLAVTHESKYKAAINTAQHQWTLTHSGTDTALNSLPASPFHLAQEPATQRTTQLRALLGSSVGLSIYSVYANGTSLTALNEVEFGPLGSTTRSEETVIWLSAGSGRATRYVPVRVNPITGLATVGSFQSTAPPQPAGASSVSPGSGTSSMAVTQGGT